MFEKNPDEVLFFENQKLAELYLNEDKNWLRIILYTWNFEDNVPTQVATSCFTVDINDFDDEGYIIYDFNNKEHASNEYLFDRDNNLKAQIHYMVSKKYPFNIITSSRDSLGTEIGNTTYLNRSQKIWCFDEFSTLDEFGKIKKYTGDLFNCGLTEESLEVQYDRNDNLISINGTIARSEEYGEYKPMQTIFEYGAEGKLKQATYYRPSIIYGTADSCGKLYYDDNERLIFNKFYVTHGSISRFLFYKDDNIRPWAIVTFDSMASDTWTENEIRFEAGHILEVQLFLEEENN